VPSGQCYETFLERSPWPSFMLAGRSATRDALLPAPTLKLKREQDESIDVRKVKVPG